MDLVKYLIFLMKQILSATNLMNIILGLLTRLTKNKMLAYMKIVEDKLIDMFSTPTVIRKIKDVNYKGYVHDKL